MRSIRLLLLGAASLCASLSAWAQAQPNIPKGIEKDLTHKLLTLRGLYRSEKLHFSADGVPLGAAEASFGPADAMFDLDRAEQKAGKLILTGNLPAMFYNKEAGKLTFSHGRIKRVIEIDLPSPTWAAAMDSFWKVFFKPDEAAAPPCTPEEAEAFRVGKPHKVPQPASTSPNAMCLPTGERVFATIGPGVKPPHALYDPEPNYDDKAKKSRLQGSNKLSVVIDRRGLPSAIMVTAPLGGGLDEESIKAVHSWRFEPATADGKPVAVLVTIETSFHLY